MDWKKPPKEAIGKFPLYEYAEAGDFDRTEQLLDINRDPHGVVYKGKTPADAAREAGHLGLADMIDSYDAPNPPLDGVLDKATLLRPDREGFCPLDHPTIWKNFGKVVEILARGGESFSKAELLATNRNGRQWMEKAAYCENFSSLARYLDQRGEPLEITDLFAIDEHGKAVAGDTAQTLLKTGQGDMLFSSGLWHGQSAETLRSAYQSLPQEAQAQVPNYHSLLVRMQQDAVTQGKGR